MAAALVAFVVGAVLDGLVVLVMLRLLSGVDVPWRGLVGGAVVGGIGLTLLKVLGTTLIAGTTSNPLFASIAIVVGLLAWLNFMSRVVLLAAAWSANSLEPDVARPHARASAPSCSRDPSPRTWRPPDPPRRLTRRPVGPAHGRGRGTHGKRADDRVNLALGAALGASAAAGLASPAGSLRRIAARR